MRAIPAVLFVTLLATPVMAQTTTSQTNTEQTSFPQITSSQTYVTHSIEARFGVGYVSGAGGSQSGPESLYEGRYTASFHHMADNGLRFRFDLGVAFGNFDSSTPPIHANPALPRRWLN